MCQAIVDGGRRCDVHRRDSIVTIALLKAETGFPDDVIEKTLNEIKKHNRGLAQDVTENDYLNYIEEVRTQLSNDTGLQTRYQRIITAASELQDGLPSNETFAALKLLRSVLNTRKTALFNELSEIANALGITPQEALDRYNSLRAEVDISRNSPIPTEYTVAAVDHALRNNLPSDKASLTALIKLRNSITSRTVDSIYQDLTSVTNGVILAGGHNPDIGSGQVELVFANNRNKKYVYHSISTDVWNSLVNAPNASIALRFFNRNIRSNLYETVDDATAASQVYNCESCGQFRNLDHDCPQRDNRETTGLTEWPNLSLVSNADSLPASENHLYNSVDELSDYSPSSQEHENLNETVNNMDTALEQESTETQAYDELLQNIRERLADDDFDSMESDQVLNPEEALQALRALLRDDNENSEDNENNEEDDTSPAGTYDIGSLREIYPDASATVNEDGSVSISLFEDESSDDSSGRCSRITLSSSAIETGSMRVGSHTLPVFNFSEDVFTKYLPDNLSDSPLPENGVTVSNRDISGVFFNGNSYAYARHKLSESEIFDQFGDLPETPDGFVDSFYPLRIRVEGQGTITNIVIIRKPESSVTRAIDIARNNNGEHGFEPRNIPTTPNGTVEEAEAAYAATGRGDIETVRIDINATPKRLDNFYTSDDSYSSPYGYRYQDPKSIIRLPRFNRVRDVINNGGAVTVPVDWGVKSNNGWQDADGLDIDVKRVRDTRMNSYWGFHVTGDISFRRNETGAVEVISSPVRSLKCNCAVYSRNYRCVHTVHVANNYRRLVEMEVPVPAPAPTTPVDNSSQPVTRSTRRRRAPGELPVALAALNPTIVRNGETTTSPISRLSFDSSPVGRRRTVDSSLPETVSNPLAVGVSDFESVQSSLSFSNIRPALGRAEEVATVNTLNLSGGHSLSGVEVVYAKREDGSPYVKEVSLPNRCSCGRFISALGGNCLHEHVIKNFPDSVMGTTPQTPARRRRGENRIPVELSRNIVTALTGFSGLPNDVSGFGGEETAERLARAEVLVADFVAGNDVTEGRVNELVELNTILARVKSEANLAFAAEQHRLRSETGNTNSQLDSLATAYRQARRSAWEEWDAYPKLTEADHESLVAQLERFRDTDPRETMEFITENATHGICDPNVEGSRRFGVELEYVTRRNRGSNVAVGEAISAKLHEHGLSKTSRFLGYHGTGGVLDYETWGNERDCTVSGETVSPPMSDTPEYWQQLNDVLDIIRSEGGRVSSATGAHVHISSASFRKDQAMLIEATRLTKKFSSVLYRVGTSPTMGVHRNEASRNGRTYSAPVPDRYNQAHVSSSTNHNNWQIVTGHSTICNTSGSSRGSKKDNIEYRWADGELDLKYMQMNIIINAFLTEHAEKNVIHRGHSDPVDTSGSYALNPQPVNIEDPSTTEALREFLNLFPDERIRSNIIKMFGARRYAYVM